MAKTAPAPKAPPPTTALKKMEIDLTPSPDAAQGLTLRQEAQALVVKDVDSHRSAKIFIRDGKSIIRNISEHWSRVTRRVDELKRGLLDDKRSDLAPVEEAVALVEQKSLAYENAEAKRVREENERRQREAENEARTKRERELAEQETQALRLEQDSAELSNREKVFVEALLGLAETPHETTSRMATTAATRAGYRNPEQAGQRLCATDKIQTALKDKRAAIALRKQSAALKAAPVTVGPVEEVKKQTASVAGVSTRTYYSCEVFDPAGLIAAVISGHTVPAAVEPHQTWLNRQAEQIKDAAIFEQAFPGCRLKSRQGIAG